MLSARFVCLTYTGTDSSNCECRQSCSPGPSCKRNRHEQVADDEVDEEAKVISRRERNRSALHDCMTVTWCCKLRSASLSPLCVQDQLLSSGSLPAELDVSFRNLTSFEFECLPHQLSSVCVASLPHQLFR